MSLCAVTFRYNFGLSSNVVDFLLCFTITHLYISFKETKNAEQISLTFVTCTYHYVKKTDGRANPRSRLSFEAAEPDVLTAY